MNILLLANQPESTTRLQLFRETLIDLEYSVTVPSFGTRNWIAIARASRNLLLREKPDVVHIFNVPDIIYRTIPGLRGAGFRKLVYDYRSPWGIEYQMNFGHAGRWVAEQYERKLAGCADSITTVNTPLGVKVRTYLVDNSCPVRIIPNYPKKSFTAGEGIFAESDDAANPPVLFVGRVCKQEGIDKFIRTAREIPERHFWIVGDGPFSWYYLKNKPPNLTFLGWQTHQRVAEYIRKSGICLIPREENALTPYSNDKSIWKLNEYLNMGKLVIASGISMEEPRKNLNVVPTSSLGKTIRSFTGVSPEPLLPRDFRFWEQNRDLIREVYEAL